MIHKSPYGCIHVCPEKKCSKKGDMTRSILVILTHLLCVLWCKSNRFNSCFCCCRWNVEYLFVSHFIQKLSDRLINMSFITFMIITWDYYFFFNVPGHRSFLFHFFTFALFQINLREIFIIIYHLIHRIEYYFYQKRTMAAYFGCFYFPLLPQESVMILQAKDFILVFRYFFP